MPRMFLTFQSTTVSAVLGAAVVALATSGCATSTAYPADSHLAGNWQLDRAASDDPDVVIAKAVNQAEARFRKRLARYGMGAPGGQGSADSAPGQGSPDGAPEGPDYSLDTPGDRYGGPGLVGPDFRGLRQRLRQALYPPRTLMLDVDDGEVDIGADRLPPREYHVGEKISRIDEYGTAIITPSFVHEQFVLKSRYTSRAQRMDSYNVDPASGALNVTEQITDPMAGRMIVHSVYRRG